MHAGIHPPNQTPPGPGRPPGPDPPPLDQTPPPPRPDPPGPGRPPRPGRHLPPGADPPPHSRHPPPGSRLQHMVNEWLVRILLECILVLFCIINGRCCNFFVFINSSIVMNSLYNITVVVFLEI